MEIGDINNNNTKFLNLQAEKKMYRGIIHDTLKNMIQLSYITCFSSRMNIDKWEKGNYHIQELNESSTNKTSLSVHQKAYRTYPTMNKTDLDTEHISNNPQGFVGIFVLLVKMKPRNYIGRNIQLTNKYNIKTGKYHDQIKMQQ